MKKNIILIGFTFMLSSCVVSTAAKVVKTAAKATYGVVKGTVKGVSWAVSKAKGKIKDDKLDGTWKLVGIYNGTYEEYSKTSNLDTSFENNCNEDLLIVFKAKKSKFQPIHCKSEKVDWIKYELDFGKNSTTNEKENYFTYNSRNNVSVIDATNKTLVLEGTLMNTSTHKGRNLYLFEKN